jgi:hypothetical protein
MKIKAFVLKYFDTIETVLIIAFFVALLLIIFQIDYSNYVLKGSLISIAIIYWFKTLENIEDNKFILKFSQKLSWYSLVIVPISIMSKLQFNQKAELFLIFSIILLVLSIILNIFVQIKNKSSNKIGIFIRQFICVIITVFLFSIPSPILN